MVVSFESMDEMAKKSHNVAFPMKANEEFLPLVLYYAVAVKRTSSQL